MKNKIKSILTKIGKVLRSNFVKEQAPTLIGFMSLSVGLLLGITELQVVGMLFCFFGLPYSASMEAKHVNQKYSETYNTNIAFIQDWMSKYAIIVEQFDAIHEANGVLVVPDDKWIEFTKVVTLRDGFGIDDPFGLRVLDSKPVLVMSATRFGKHKAKK